MSDKPKLSGINKVIEVGRALTALMPVIITLVRTAEENLPIPGQGAAKLQLVRETLESFFEGVQDAAVDFADIWPSVQRFIGVLIRALNAAGVLRSSQK